MNYTLQRNAYGMVTNAADARGRRWTYAYGRNSTPLGETQSVCGRTNALVRAVDAFLRPVGLVLSVEGVRKGGVGGLLADSCDGTFFFPVYDNNGNVMKYVDESGAVVAAYVYDDFGRIISQAGSFADTFGFRFSTKYFDGETGLIAYQRRYDAALTNYKNVLEKVCECPDVAHAIYEREELKLFDVFKKQESYHDWLDSPNGPHHHR